MREWGMKQGKIFKSPRKKIKNRLVCLIRSCWTLSQGQRGKPLKDSKQDNERDQICISERSLWLLWGERTGNHCNTLEDLDFKGLN